MISNTSSTIANALIRAMSENLLDLHVAGPCIEIDNSGSHFYQVWMKFKHDQTDRKPILISGQLLPNGYQYLLESNPDYAESVLVDVLAQIHWGNEPIYKDAVLAMVEHYQAKMEPEAEKQPTNDLELFTPDTIKFEISSERSGAHIGEVYYKPENADGERFVAYSRKPYLRRILRGFVPSDGWPSLQIAVQKVLEEAERTGV